MKIDIYIKDKHGEVTCKGEGWFFLPFINLSFGKRQPLEIIKWHSNGRIKKYIRFEDEEK